MHVVYAWLRRRPLVVDGGWALLLLGIGLLELNADQWLGPYDSALVALLLLVAALLLRRRAPVAVVVLTAAAGLIQLAADVPPTLFDAAMPVVVYNTAAYAPRRVSRLALVGCVAAPGLALWRWWDAPNISAVHLGFFGLMVTGPFVIAWLLGDSMRTKRAYYAELEDRAARLERERDAQARVAAAAERARIARELHDVVAHNVSVMVVQADGAAYALDASPESARGALETISVTGREALAEMRRLLGVLRSGADPSTLAPQPGIDQVDQLEDLLDQVRKAGLTVEFTQEGIRGALPSAVSLAGYRIVQEALTNTRKHAGSDAVAHVRIAYLPRSIELDVLDDGRGDQAPGDGMGHGLIGMRERVTMLGGSLRTGPAAQGGWRVHAVLPLDSAAEAAAAAVRDDQQAVVLGDDAA